MKRKISIALLLALVLSLTAIAGCINPATPPEDDNSDKRAPAYRGIAITSASTENLVSRNGAAKNGGDDPFDKSIEDAIKASISVVGVPVNVYYATAGEDIYVNIYLDNPDSLEITSVILNGDQYSSDAFESGSDTETVILKCNVGESAGIVEYTVGAVKYIDGAETKDVAIEDNATVLAGVNAENQLVADVSGIDIGTNAVSLKVNVKDNCNLIGFSAGALKAVIYDGSKIVGAQDLTVGQNTVKFEGLKTETTYQYAIVGYYDDLSGDGFEMHLLYKAVCNTDRVVSFNNVTVGQEEVSFGLLWHEDHTGKTLSALKLYSGNKLVETLSANATAVTNLLSNNTYKLVAEYRNGKDTESIYVEFTTLAKATPEISVVNPTQTQTSVGFELTETDTDNVGAVTKIELIHTSGTVVAESIEQRAFENLLSGNAYTVKVTYVYDLNDGAGEHTVEKELAITTDAKVAPSVTVFNENITTGSVSAEYTIADTDNTLADYKIELYLRESLVEENTNKLIDFKELDYYTNYTVRISYTYDLCDGEGEQTGTYDYTFRTLPYIDVAEFTISNTTAVMSGDTIYVTVQLDNPFRLAVESVVINGETYGVTRASTKSKLFVEIVYDGQFAGGDTYLKVDKINAKLGDAPFTVEPATKPSDNIFINGKLEVQKVEFVNEAFEPVDWVFSSDSVYVLITLDNATGYTVDSINTDITELIKLDNNRWYCPASVSIGWNTIAVDSIRYHNEYLNNTITCSDIQTHCYKVASDEIKYVSTPDDLLNMSDKYYYELKNDIDLSGCEWLGAGFEGIFNGKGYSIKNMTFVSTVKNTHAYLGLFTYGSGVIQNVNITGATVNAEIMSDDGNSYNAYVGGLVAKSDGVLNIHNCTVDEYSTFTVKNTVGFVYVGGLVGSVYDCTVTSCTNGADIGAVSNAKDCCVGAIAGSITVADIENCVNNGKVSATSSSWYACAGGMVGSVSCGSVTNCINSADVSAASGSWGAYAGGMVGCVYGSETMTITDCANSADIRATSSSWDAYTGDMIGRVY